MQAPAAQPAQSDQVELSEAARTYQAERADSAADARIRDLRARIAEDDYITDEMLDYVVDRLHEELFGKA